MLRQTGCKFHVIYSADRIPVKLTAEDMCGRWLPNAGMQNTDIGLVPWSTLPSVLLQTVYRWYTEPKMWPDPA